MNILSSPRTAFSYLRQRLQVIRALKARNEYRNAFFANRFFQPVVLALQPALPIHRIQLRLTGEVRLPLVGIELFTRQGNTLVYTGGQATMHGSSLVFPKGLAVDEFALNRVAGDVFAQTVLELNPWITIVLEEPVTVDMLVLHTRRRAQSAYRTHSLRVQVACASDPDPETAPDWMPVFDHPALVARFLEELALTRLNHPWAARAKILAKDVDLLLLYSLVGYYEAATIVIKKLEKGEDYPWVKAFIGEHILRGRDMEFTSHGLVRSFRYFRREEKQAYLAEGMKVVHLLRAFTPNVLFAYGSSLGFVREPEHFIPHDDDMDILVLLPRSRFPLIRDARDALAAHLRAGGYTILKTWSTHLQVRTPFKSLDVFAAVYDADGLVEAFPTHRGKYLHTDYLLPPLDIDIMGFSCPIPANPFTYLEVVYGKDWREPINKRFHKRHTLPTIKR